MKMFMILHLPAQSLIHNSPFKTIELDQKKKQHKNTIIADTSIPTSDLTATTPTTLPQPQPKTSLTAVPHLVASIAATLDDDHGDSDGEIDEEVVTSANTTTATLSTSATTAATRKHKAHKDFKNVTFKGFLDEYTPLSFTLHHEAI